jgi:hypothetical protein
MKVHTIIPGLYQRGEFSKMTRSAKVSALEMLGVKVVISCYGSYDKEIPAVDGVTYHYVPFRDGRVIPVPMLEAPVADAVSALRRKEGVLVHCHAGRNRAGLVAALIVRQTYGV